MNAQKINEPVEAYCNAWLRSFAKANPYHTVTVGPEDKVHIEAGVKAAIDTLQAERDALKANDTMLRTKCDELLAAAQKDATAWKQMAEFQYAIRAYPDNLDLGTGALDAYMQGWSRDAAIAATNDTSNE